MQLGMLTAAQGEAVITALVHKSLAEAETRRSLAGPRGADAIEAVRRDHLAGAAAWRDALRRDDLSIIAPLAADAAALVGFADPDQRSSPISCARTASVPATGPASSPGSIPTGRAGLRRGSRSWSRRAPPKRVRASRCASWPGRWPASHPGSLRPGRPAAVRRRPRPHPDRPERSCDARGRVARRVTRSCPGMAIGAPAGDLHPGLDGAARLAPPDRQEGRDVSQSGRDDGRKAEGGGARGRSRTGCRRPAAGASPRTRRCPLCALNQPPDQ